MALTTIEFAQKAKDGTLTVEEAVAFAENEPGVSPSAKKRIRALRSGFKKMGLETSMLYKNLKDKLSSVIADLYGLIETSHVFAKKTPPYFSASRKFFLTFLVEKSMS